MTELTLPNTKATTTATNTLIVRNALIVTCDQNHSVIHDGAMLVAGRDIVWLGPEGALGTAIPADRLRGARTLDAKGRILMPGLINMHAHCGDTLFRGLVEDLPLEAWLNAVWKAEAAILARPEHCYLGAALGFAELLLGGTTTVMDMFWHADQSFAAAAKTGIRLASGGIYFDPPGMDGLGPQTRAGNAQALFDTFGQNDEVFVGTLPHSTYTVGPEALSEASARTRRQGGFFCTHAAETRAEQSTINTRYGTSVIRHLDALGCLSQRAILAHCVHLDDTEIGLLANSGTHVAHNPLSNLKIGSGIAPVAKMLARGINLTLGTDGPISGNDMDMWLALRLVATIHKGVAEDATLVSTKEALHMATLNGARALGAEGYLGSISAGKRADFILLDIGAPHANPMFDPITHLVYAAGRGDVRAVFVSGRQVVADGQLLGVDTGELCDRARALVPEIKAAGGAAT